MWTLRGARVSVSTFQRENFFGYKLAPALDGLFPEVLMQHRRVILFWRELVPCWRRPRARGAVASQCSGFYLLDEHSMHILVTDLQELVNLAPFVLDDGSIVTGEFQYHFHQFSSHTSQAQNLPRAWSWTAWLVCPWTFFAELSPIAFLICFRCCLKCKKRQ